MPVSSVFFCLGIEAPLVALRMLEIPFNHLFAKEIDGLLENNLWKINKIISKKKWTPRAHENISIA